MICTRGATLPVALAPALLIRFARKAAALPVLAIEREASFTTNMWFVNTQRAVRVGRLLQRVDLSHALVAA